MLRTLAQVTSLVRDRPGVHVRFSGDIDADLRQGSLDAESGIRLPGVSVNPLAPEDWWTRPTEDWVARQLCQYAHLLDEEPGRHAYLLEGTVVGRGPDREPLLMPARLVDRLDDSVLREAQRVYEERFQRR